MNDVLHNIIQALEKLVMHGGATTNGMVPALISQAQDDLARAKAGLAEAQGDAAAMPVVPIAPAEPVADPPPVVEPVADPPVEEPPPPVSEAPPDADPGTQAAAGYPPDTLADALNADEAATNPDGTTPPAPAA